MRDILQHVPVWVFILFFFLASRGIKALKPRLLSPLQAILLPLLMILWSASSLLSGQVGAWGALSWLGALVLAFFVQDLAFSSARPSFDPESGCLRVPGSSQPLWLMLGTFALHFVFEMQRTLHPEIAQMREIVMGVYAGYGLASGIFMARLWAVVQVLPAWRRFAGSKA